MILAMCLLTLAKMGWKKTRNAALNWNRLGKLIYIRDVNYV